MRLPFEGRVVRIQLNEGIRVAEEEPRGGDAVTTEGVGARGPVCLAGALGVVVHDEIAVVLEDEVAAAFAAGAATGVGIPQGLAVLVDDQVAIGLVIEVVAAVGGGERGGGGFDVEAVVGVPAVPGDAFGKGKSSGCYQWRENSTC